MAVLQSLSFTNKNYRHVLDMSWALSARTSTGVYSSEHLLQEIILLNMLQVARTMQVLHRG